MRAAYCRVVVHCLEERECFSGLKGILSLRVREKELFDASLVSDDLLRLIEGGVLDLNASALARYKELDVSEVVRAYVEEVLERMGPSFLELFASNKIMNHGGLNAEPVQPTPRPPLATPKRRAVEVYEIKNLKKQRERKRWTTKEEDTLREGVQKYGMGKWKLILFQYQGMFNNRTEVDLKDKWRNLTR